MPDNTEGNREALSKAERGQLRLAVVAQIDGLAKTEIDLVSHRIGWLLVSEAFLFTALATVWATRTSSAGAPRGTCVLLATIGLALVVCIVPSIAAAHSMSRKLARLRAPFYETLFEDCPPSNDGDGQWENLQCPKRWENLFGQATPWALCAVYVSAWAAVLIWMCAVPTLR